MTADFTSDHHGRMTHKKGARVSHVSGPVDPGQGAVESRPDLQYNGPTKSQSFRIVARREYSVLDPLLSGKSVTLNMQLHPPVRAGKKRLSDGKPIAVVIVPGPVFGTTQDRYLVAVVGRGSAVITPRKNSGVANLVLAGIPQRLAHALMDEFRRVLK